MKTIKRVVRYSDFDGLILTIDEDGQVFQYVRHAGDQIFQDELDRMRTAGTLTIEDLGPMPPEEMGHGVDPR